VGINFYISDDDVIHSGVFIKGNESSVLSIGFAIVKAHIHPYTLYNGETPYQPPTCIDLVQSIWDSLGGTQFNIVFETLGAWVYTITPTYLNKLIKIDRSLEKYILNPLTFRNMHENDKMNLRINSKLTSILDEIKEKCNENTYEFLFDRTINLKTYLKRIRNLMGKNTFDIYYVPYEQELSLKIKDAPHVNNNVENTLLLSTYDINTFLSKMKGAYENYVIR
jgi:hypothetical protein